jgi:hypothetical protein
MHELGVPADRDDLRTDLLEGLVLLCQSSELGGSDEGEVRGIEEQDRPFLRRFKGGEADLAEIPLRRLEGLQFELRDFLTDP